MAKTFFKTEWHHDPPYTWGNEFPVFIYTEMDEDRWEKRCVEIFPDGTLGWADAEHPEGRTTLGYLQNPTLDEIGAQNEFTVELISQTQFEEIWHRAHSQDARPAEMEETNAAGMPAETRDLFCLSERSRFERDDLAGMRMGKDLGADIVLLDNGPVVAVADSTVWFVNSSLQQYRASLALVGGHRDIFRGNAADEATEQRRVDALEWRLRQLDGAAIDQRWSYWACIIEQMRSEQF